MVPDKIKSLNQGLKVWNRPGALKPTAKPDVQEVNVER